MKKYLLSILLFFCCVNVVFADDINWTVKQSENYSFNNTQILTPKSSSFNKNVDCIFMPIKEKEIPVVTRTTTPDTARIIRRSLASSEQLDPFVIKVDGIKYYMVQNNKILGEDSTLDTIYKPLYLLDKNNDKKITSAELKNGNIRFVRLNNSGQLELNNKSLDYPLANISYIDLNTLRRTQNAGDIGSFGYFDIYINHNYQIKKFIGQITYENKEDINRLMGR
mgnify:FL=1